MVHAQLINKIIGAGSRQDSASTKRRQQKVVTRQRVHKIGPAATLHSAHAQLTSHRVPAAEVGQLLIECHCGSRCQRQSSAGQDSAGLPGTTSRTVFVAGSRVGTTVSWPHGWTAVLQTAYGTHSMTDSSSTVSSDAGDPSAFRVVVPLQSTTGTSGAAP